MCIEISESERELNAKSSPHRGLSTVKPMGHGTPSPANIYASQYSNPEKSSTSNRAISRRSFVFGILDMLLPSSQRVEEKSLQWAETFQEQ